MIPVLSLHHIIFVPVILSMIEFRWAYAAGPACTGVGQFNRQEVINYQWGAYNIFTVGAYDPELEEGENVKGDELEQAVCKRAATIAEDTWRDWKHATQAWKFKIKSTGTFKTVNANFLVTEKGAIHLSVIKRNEQYIVYYGGVRLEPEKSKSENDASSSTST